MLTSYGVPCSWLTCLLPRKERGRGAAVGLESWQAQGRSSSKSIAFLRKKGSHHYTWCIFLGIIIPDSSLSDIVLAWHSIYFATFHPEPCLAKIIHTIIQRTKPLEESEQNCIWIAGQRMLLTLTESITQMQFGFTFTSTRLLSLWQREQQYCPYYFS